MAPIKPKAEAVISFVSSGRMMMPMQATRAIKPRHVDSLVKSNICLGDRGCDGKSLAVESDMRWKLDRSAHASKLGGIKRIVDRLA